MFGKKKLEAESELDLIKPKTEAEVAQFEVNETRLVEMLAYENYMQSTGFPDCRDAKYRFLARGLRAKFRDMSRAEKNITYLRHIPYRMQGVGSYVQEQKDMKLLWRVSLMRGALEKYHSDMEKYYRDIMHQVAIQPRKR